MSNTARTGRDVVTFKVDPTVWAEGLRLADGDARRVEIRGRFDIVVHNHPLPPGRRVTRATPDSDS